MYEVVTKSDSFFYVIFLGSFCRLESIWKFIGENSEKGLGFKFRVTIFMALLLDEFL